MREIFASFTSSSGSNGSFLSLSLSCNRVHLFLSFALLSLPRKKDDDSKKKTISVVSLTKNAPPLCVRVQSLREEEEEERFNTNRIVESDLERGRKKREDGAQQQ